jgi:prophage regulatory protein
MSVDQVIARGATRATPGAERLLGAEAVIYSIGISRSTLYLWVQRGLFPKPKKIGPRRVAWLESSVQQFIASREAA